MEDVEEQDVGVDRRDHFDEAVTVFRLS